MAGEWIKMRNNLWDDPRVARLCDLTGHPEAMIIGGLYWLWSSADEHTESGHMPGLSVRAIDRKTGCKGLGAGLIEVGWISDTPDGVTISKFNDHNGATAKARANTAKRANKHRSGNAGDAQEPQNRNAVSVTKPEESNAVSVTEPLRVRYLELEEEKKKKEIQERAVSVQRPSRAPDDGGDDQGPGPGWRPGEPGFGQGADADPRLSNPTPAGEACKAMRAEGLASVNPGDPRLLTLLSQGATVPEFAGLAAEAVAGGKGFAWLLAALAGRRAQAVTIALAPAADSAAAGRVRHVETQALLAQQRRNAEAATPMPDHLKRQRAAA